MQAYFMNYTSHHEKMNRKTPFKRIVKEIGAEINPQIKFRNDAMTALQEACEHYLIDIYKNANLCAIHANRKTITCKDFQLARRIKGKDTFTSSSFEKQRKNTQIKKK